MTATLSHILSMTRISWVMTTIVTPKLSFISFSRSSIWRVVFGSSAEVASSQRRYFGFVASALAIATRCFCPPESWDGYGGRPVLKSDQLQKLQSARLRVLLLDPRKLQREADVLYNVALLQKVEALEYHANLLAELQKLPAGQLREALAVDYHLAAGRAFEEVYADAPRCSFLRR